MIPGPEFVQNYLSGIWPEWRVTRHLEKENGRSVFEICRSDSGVMHSKALKVLYFENVSDQFAPNAAAGLNYLYSMNRQPNIVQIEDFSVSMNGNNCLILIRTERMLTLPERITSGVPFSREEVIRLGSEICAALDFCEQQRIIHSDIRFTSILSCSDNTYKLGDFGVPRSMNPIIVQNPADAGTTLLCIAPEIYRNEGYTNTADIYSLGIILYTLMNDNFSPFTREIFEQTGILQTSEANMLRLSGKEFPAPKNADGNLASVIMKACSFNPGDRFRTAKEFQAALSGCLEESTVNIIPAKGGPMTGGPTAGGGSKAGGPTAGGGSKAGGPTTGGPKAGSGSKAGGPTTGGSKAGGPTTGGPETGDPVSDPLFNDPYPGYTSKGTGKGSTSRRKSPYIKILNALIGICTVLIICILLILFKIPSRIANIFDNIEHHPVNYKITYVDESGALLEETIYEGHEGDEIEFTAPEKDGYTLREPTQSMTLISDPDENRLIFVYDSDGSSTEEPKTDTSTETTTEETTESTETTTTQTTTEAPTTTTSRAEAKTNVIVWSDPKLESAVKQYLNITEDLSLQQAGAITKLAVNNSGVTDISDLQYFPAIEELHLENNAVADLSALSGMHNLKILQLESNQVSDITPLIDCTSLTKLDLYDNMVTDISAVQGMTSLQKLDFRKNKVSDLTPLKGLKDLKELYASDNRFSDVQPIAGLTKLTYLSISNNNVSDISSLKNLTDLRVFTLTDNNIHDISVLRNFKKIYHLKINGNPIDDYSPLDIYSSKVYVDYLDG